MLAPGFLRFGLELLRNICLLSGKKAVQFCIKESFAPSGRTAITIHWTAALCLSLIAPVCAQRGPFPKKKCAVPFNEAPGKNLYVDNHCGLKGVVSASSSTNQKTADRAQNSTKNNLCATGAGTTLSFSDLAALQQQVDDAHILYGNAHAGGSGPPVSRTAFTSDHALPDGSSVHEGSIVTLVAYILDSKYSPAPSADSGETANCGATFPTRVDIHLTLGETATLIPTKGPERDKLLCSSVTAEVIPHMRPAVWSNEWFTNVRRLQRPVRVTGQLMFDGSHHPCSDGKPTPGGNPLRVSSWEIHPVYAVAVCKHGKIGECAPADEASWEKISQVADLPEPETEGPE